MAFLSINDEIIPVEVESPSETTIEIGARERAFSGQIRNSRRAIKRMWEMGVVHVTEAVSDRIRAVVLGLGQLWHFDADHFSTKGLGNDGTDGEIRLSAAAIPTTHTTGDAKYGSGAVSVDDSTTNLLTSNQRRGGDASSDTTGFAIVGGAGIAHDTTRALEGTGSIKVTCAADAVVDGVEVSFAAAATTSYSGSVYILADSGTPSVEVELDSSAGGGPTDTTNAITLSSTKWTRVETTLTTSGAGALVLRIQELAPGGDGPIFYVDALQIEAKTTTTSWVDGARATTPDPNYDFSSIPTGNDLTINFWAKSHRFTSAGIAVRITQPIGSNNLIALDRAGSIAVRFVTFDAGATSDLIQSVAAVWDGSFHMVTAVIRTNPGTNESKKELYFDGVLESSSNPANLPDLSALTKLDLGGVAGARWNNLLEDVLVAPYAASAAQVAAWFARTTAQASLPNVEASGDFAPDDPVTVIGEMNRRDYNTGAPGGTFANNISTTNFTLHEF